MIETPIHVKEAHFLGPIVITEPTKCVACLCNDAVLELDGLCSYCSASLQITQHRQSQEYN